MTSGAKHILGTSVPVTINFFMEWVTIFHRMRARLMFASYFGCGTNMMNGREALPDIKVFEIYVASLTVIAC